MKSFVFCHRSTRSFCKWKAIGLLSSALLPWLTPSSCEAQETRFLSQGYIFVSPGILAHEQTVFGTVGFGGGGERFVSRKLAVGAEIGYLKIFGSPPYVHDPGNSFGLVCLNASYVKPTVKKLAPFIIGGYSLGFGDGTASFINIGGGVTWWAKKRTGIRFELRDHFYPDDCNDHFLGLRIGLAFR